MGQAKTFTFANFGETGLLQGGSAVAPYIVISMLCSLGVNYSSDAQAQAHNPAQHPRFSPLRGSIIANLTVEDGKYVPGTCGMDTAVVLLPKNESKKIPKSRLKM
jgi:hypothetical protein